MLYLLLTVLQSFPAVFGIRTEAEARHRVVAVLAPGIEVRAYAPGAAIETDGPGDGFSRLFRYIAGDNDRGATISMTTPVEQRFAAGERPSPSGGTAAMRFFLPDGVDPPAPGGGGRVRVVGLPERTVATARFSGRITPARFDAEAARLRAALAAAGREAAGEPYLLGYDPPFTLPFLRRNEVAVDLAPSS